MPSQVLAEWWNFTRFRFLFGSCCGFFFDNIDAGGTIVDTERGDGSFVCLRSGEMPSQVSVTEWQMFIRFRFLFVLRIRLGLILGRVAEVGFQHRCKSVLS